MDRVRMRFKRMADAFDELGRARVCQSSGSEHSPENSPENSQDLSALVNSFIERVNPIGGYDEEINQDRKGDKADDDDLEMNDILKRLLGYEVGDFVKRNIKEQVEQAWSFVGENSSLGYKRRLMTRLREKGFDAGLCKSKWEKNGRYPAGDYEYIDVQINGTRYLIEVFLAGEFKIARPTDSYSSLLEVIPSIFVGQIEEFKQVVRLMCNAIKKSMKRGDMHVPPWRRYAYVQAKWFGAYKRTINEFPIEKACDNEDNSLKKRSVGFFPLPDMKTSYYCREDFASKGCLKVGNLAAAINGTKHAF